MPSVGDTIRATVDGRVVEGAFQSADVGDTGQERWTVKVANGVLVYVMPANPGVQAEVIGPSAPAPVSPDGSVAMGREEEVKLPVIGSLNDFVLPKSPPSPIPELEPEVEQRFAVKRVGKKVTAHSYHLYGDCGHVPSGDDVTRITVTDDMVVLFDLEVCKFCQKRKSRVTNADALVDAAKNIGVTMSAEDAQVVMKHLADTGFKITPDWVASDRETC